MPARSAITRPVTAGRLDQRTEPGISAAPRRMPSLTGTGRDDLLERLRHPRQGRHPGQAEITDLVRFHTLLAFPRHLPDRREQAGGCVAVRSSRRPPRAAWLKEPSHRSISPADPADTAATAR